MGVRFCNDEDVMDGSVKFGFVTSKTACFITVMEGWLDKPTMFFINVYSSGANNGAGIEFGYIGPCAVSFKGLAFDSAGGLPFQFHSHLLNPDVSLHAAAQC